MSKLYFLAPSAKVAKQIVAELRNDGVTEDDIGVLAHSEAVERALPDAGVDDTSDVKPALKQGAAVGGATGLLAGLTAAIVPGGFAVGGAALLGVTLAGSAFGAWASSLIGISVPNREVETFQRAIEAGEVLMIVSTADIDRGRLRTVVSRVHPAVVYGGEQGAIKTVA